MRTRTPVLVLLVALSVLAACTSGDTTSTSDTSDSASTQSVPSGPAPGVTDNSIKVGVLYVDLKAIGNIASLDHGNYKKAYEALFDQINQTGGIGGRKIDPVIVGVNPVGTNPAEAACVKLTQDEQVFLVMGFFQGDAMLCPLETHATAVIGGQMSPERLKRAKAPWFTADSGTDLQSDIIRAMDGAGELDGKLGVYASPADEAQMKDIVLPLLDELGVKVADSAVVDAPEDDLAAQNAATGIIAERFKSSGVDKVLAIGSSGLGWASGTENKDYRPKLLLTDPSSIQAFANDKAGHDLSVLDGAVAGNQYGPAENIWKLPAMQKCIKTVEKGGVPVPEPDSLPAGSGSVYIAGTTACIQVTLLQALLEAAGKNLNYGTLGAIHDLKVDLPSQPDPLTYGPAPHADGDPRAYLYDWDADAKAFELRTS